MHFSPHIHIHIHSPKLDLIYGTKNNSTGCKIYSKNFNYIIENLLFIELCIRAPVIYAFLCNMD